jgi:hypothetical protein
MKHLLRIHAIWLAACPTPGAAETDHDVVVYGGTSAG